MSDSKDEDIDQLKEAAEQGDEDARVELEKLKGKPQES